MIVVVGRKTDSGWEVFTCVVAEIPQVDPALSLDKRPQVITTPRVQHAQLHSSSPVLQMSPTPLSPSTVQVVLQYLSPPSQLDQPLPPYLLSKSLLQRHHFLSISPDDPQEYLCWPTSREQAPKAIEFLDAIPVPAGDDAPRNFPVNYSFDGEYMYAHVDVSHDNTPGARLVFQWDEDDGWKYHDAGIMPFPPNSQASLMDVLQTKPSIHQPAAANPVDSFNSYGFDSEPSSDDDDYWNAYGSQDALDESEKDLLSSSSDAVGTEDAYWAQYASVHGKIMHSQTSFILYSSNPLMLS